ncbi:heme ABC exporter ATP-binding protein CcmA [Rhizobium oryzicola]|uniref:Heme ABC exporter ATP-binding protein CcmA n=1 Tax=Rhizobium oryzicola TaxID=1232668 RepID=A0ABT8SZV4_9HYPH|nr:heme ABC exporter ATP-binding protein CcmA [Rhizobium oryzicola]MDO1583975.1 heme ABC exporter ATP-binding protein CcmA [Rhizobium oryzicola]
MRLTAENLSAHRGEDLIFSNISFDLQGGEALVLTGRNGSGKSTLLRVLAGLLKPPSGSVHLSYKDGRQAPNLAEEAHYLGHRNAMKPELTVRENLAFWKSFFGDREGGAGFSIGDAAAMVELEQVLHLPFAYLSAGQQRRMAFAKLLVAYRPVWILDEPTAALDVKAEALLASLMRDHQSQGGMLLAATHQPLELLNVKPLEMKGFEFTAEEWE